jgi:uncharacterized DUF497 family protein
VKIVWDEPKRQANIVKHGLDFADIGPEFFDEAILQPSHSDRFLAFGRHNGTLMIAVVFRPLGAEALSVVSMRPANVRERMLFHG